jgi:hypothetical protein
LLRIRRRRSFCGRKLFGIVEWFRIWSPNDTLPRDYGDQTMRRAHDSAYDNIMRCNITTMIKNKKDIFLRTSYNILKKHVVAVVLHRGGGCSALEPNFVLLRVKNFCQTKF